jgi:hypothetical protein
MNKATTKESPKSRMATEPVPVAPEGALTGVPHGTLAATADHPEVSTARMADSPPAAPPQPAVAPPGHRYRKWLLLAGIAAALVVGG